MEGKAQSPGSLTGSGSLLPGQPAQQENCVHPTSFTPWVPHLSLKGQEWSWCTSTHRYLTDALGSIPCRWEVLFICPLLFFMTCIPFSDLLSRLSISLPLKGLLQKLPNSQNSLIYKQCMLLKHHLPIYWCPYSFISQSLCSSTIASPVAYPTSPSGGIFPGTSNLTCPLWTHNLTFPNLLLPSPSLAQFMVPPSSWSPCLESLAPPLLLPSSLTPHCATQSVFH